MTLAIATTYKRAIEAAHRTREELGAAGIAPLSEAEADGLRQLRALLGRSAICDSFAAQELLGEHGDELREFLAVASVGFHVDESLSEAYRLQSKARAFIAGTERPERPRYAF